MTKGLLPALEVRLQTLCLGLIGADDLFGDDEFFGLFVLDDAAATEELVLEDRYEGELLQQLRQLRLFTAAQGVEGVGAVRGTVSHCDDLL